MDFLNLMLLYLTATFAIGVQEAPAPAATPLPTAKPQTVVVQQATMPSQEPTATPVPTPKPTATPRPDPTMTPNASYATLRMGSKGAQVKKLQQRLVELGYLPEGAVDSVYGYQTLNAVRDFQKANGLSADGDAGRVTLTHIYEDPSVKEGKYKAAPTAAPTRKPADETVPGSAAQPAQPDESISPDNPMAYWTGANISQVLLNGKSLMVTRRTGSVTMLTIPQVWQTDGGKPMLNIADLSSAAKWTFVDNNEGSVLILAAAGRTLVLTAADMKDGWCTAYTAECDGEAVPLTDGDVVYVNGRCAVSFALLEKALDARCSWDKEERTILLQVSSRAAQGTGD